MELFRQDNKSNIERLNEIIRVFNKYEFDYITEKIGLKYKFSFFKRSHKYKSLEELDESFPVRLRMTLQELGPTYIKLGQMISTRPDLVGDSIALEFSKLQDNNPETNYSQIKSIVEDELNDSILNIFQYFKEKPLASASIGQVHEAKIKDGPCVAVKIQKPGVDELIKKDIAIMKFLAKRIDHYIPQSKTYNLPILVNEFERSILKEIDYIQEFNNIERFKNIFKEDSTVYVPKAYNEYSTKKILTMELIEGKKILDVSSSEGYDKKLIAKRGLKSYFNQIIDYGFFHADPHPSNLYVLNDNIICYLDFGMMGNLDNEFRENLTELFIYFMEVNVKGMINQLTYMGILNDSIDYKSLNYDLSDLMNKYYGIELKGIHGGLQDIVKLMRKYNVILPNEFVLIVRGLSMLEETGIRLDPDFNAVAILKPYTLKIVKKRLNPFKLIDLIKNNIFEIEHMIKTFPFSISKTINKLEEGNLSIEIEHKNLENITNKISVSLILSALLIGSSLVILSDKGFMVLGFPFLGLIGFVISTILGLWLIISIIKGKNF